MKRKKNLHFLVKFGVHAAFKKMLFSCFKIRAHIRDEQNKKMFM